MRQQKRECVEGFQASSKGIFRASFEVPKLRVKDNDMIGVGPRVSTAVIQRKKRVQGEKELNPRVLCITQSKSGQAKSSVGVHFMTRTSCFQKYTVVRSVFIF